MMRAALLRNGALRRLGGRRGPWLAALTALAVLAAAVGVAVWGTGYPGTRITLARGAAWLASPGSDLVTLLDGPSGLVIGSVRVAASPAADLVRTGGSALVVEPDQGTVTRIDGATYAVSAPVRFGTTGELRVLAGDSTAYVVDGARGTAAVIDPATLAVQREVALAARPGPGQSVVDGADRLWVVDGADGGLAGFDAAGTARSAAAGPASRLTVVQGRAVLVDPAGGRAGWIGDDARVTSWSCFEVGPSDGLQLLGSRAQARVYAAVPETGTLVATDLDGDECAPPVPVGRPGDAFGELVEAAGFVLVPNRTTGRTAVVDTAAGRVVADLAVLTGPAGRLELLAKDGLVFYNDLDGDRAGMIRFDGRRWDVGPAARKFAGPTLVHGGGGIPPQNPPQGLPSPRQEPDDPDGTGTGKPTPSPSATTPRPGTVAVPELVGRESQAAQDELAGVGLRPRIEEEESSTEEVGRVLRTEPEPGARVPPGSAVVLVVGSGPAASVVVPEIVGLTVEEAEQVLAERGLTLGEQTTREAGVDQVGLVLESSPGAGELLAADGSVAVVVGADVGVAVPDVVGLDDASARARLRDEGFWINLVEVDSQREKGTVVATDPPAGQLVPFGSSVTATISRGPDGSGPFQRPGEIIETAPPQKLCC